VENKAKNVDRTKNKNSGQIFVELTDQARIVYLVPVLNSHYLEDRKKSVLNVIEVLSIWFVLPVCHSQLMYIEFKSKNRVHTDKKK